MIQSTDSPSLAEHPRTRDPWPGLSRIDEIVELVDAVVDGPASGLSIHDRRNQRHEYDGPILVQPLDAHHVPTRDALLVEGRDLSTGGLSFRHAKPLAERFVSVSFPGAGRPNRGLLTELTWCTFTRTGEYLSGGRFLRALN